MSYNVIMLKISPWGAIAVVVYLAFIGWLFYLAADCRGMFCGAVTVIAALPWSMIFEDGIHLQIGSVDIEADNMVWFWTAVVLNVCIIYFLFAALQKRWTKSQKL